MRTFEDLKALIEKRGVHPEFGEVGEGFGIEQSSFELATFLVRMQELDVRTCLEIGTGYKGGLSRFLAQDMGWDVTTVDTKNYGHAFEGVHYVVGNTGGKLSNNPTFDLVFIDGAHDFDSVAHDYAYYGKTFARKAIAFHDILGLRDCDGVRQLWEEIALNHEYVGGMTTLTKKPNWHDAIFHESPQRSGIGWIEL